MGRPGLLAVSQLGEHRRGSVARVGRGVRECKCVSLSALTRGQRGASRQRLRRACTDLLRLRRYGKLSQVAHAPFQARLHCHWLCHYCQIGLAVSPFIRFAWRRRALHLELYFFCFVLNTDIDFFSYKGLCPMAFIRNLRGVSDSVFVLVPLWLRFRWPYCCSRTITCCSCTMTCSRFPDLHCRLKRHKMYPFILEKDVRPIDPGGA